MTQERKPHLTPAQAHAAHEAKVSEQEEKAAEAKAAKAEAKAAHESQVEAESHPVVTPTPAKTPAELDAEARSAAIGLGRPVPEPAKVEPVRPDPKKMKRGMDSLQRLGPFVRVGSMCFNLEHVCHVVIRDDDSVRLHFISGDNVELFKDDAATLLHAIGADEYADVGDVVVLGKDQKRQGTVTSRVGDQCVVQFNDGKTEVHPAQAVTVADVA